ncbi:MAG: hypothetical protein NVSMB12_09950 [Acidimicrobiales bacterium]
MVGRRIAWKRGPATEWLGAVVGAALTAGVGVSGVLGRRWPGWAVVALVVVLFGLAQAVPIQVSGRRWTLVPLAAVIALTTAGPLATVVAVALTAGAAGALRDRSARRAVVAVSGQAASVATAAAAFVLLGGGEAATAVTLGAAAAAAVLCCVGERTVAWGACSSVEEPSASPAHEVAGVLAGGVVAATSGVLLVRLYALGPVVPALALPLLGLLIAGARQLSIRQQAQARLDRLAAASARTTGLRSFESAVAQAAGEAGPLVDGSVALSLAIGENDALVCSIVDGAGVRPAAPDLAADMLEWVMNGPRGEVGVDGLPVRLRSLLPTACAVITAGSFDEGRPGSLAVAVLRSAPPDGRHASRSALLETFVSHAGLIATNALLFQRVEAALRDQVDMNRQKDEFLAAVSHELRTPLASMLGSVETLRRLDGRMTPDARERFFTIAHRQGKRLQRLIEELLLTASLDHRQELVVATSCQLAEVLEEVAVDLALQSDERVQVRCEPGAETVSTDPNKIRQVITNLVENATKYAPDGVIEVTAAPAGARIEVRVTDHGPGIAFADRERAFERFVQLDGSSTRAQGGTGLGLYLCRRVADLLEADLTLTETPGGGATFVLSLPRVHSATPVVTEGNPLDGRPNPAASPFAGRDRFRAGPFLDRALLDLTRGPSSGPTAGLGARPVVPSGLRPPDGGS